MLIRLQHSIFKLFLSKRSNDWPFLSRHRRIKGHFKPLKVWPGMNKENFIDQGTRLESLMLIVSELPGFLNHALIVLLFFSYESLVLLHNIVFVECVAHVHCHVEFSDVVVFGNFGLELWARMESVFVHKLRIVEQTLDPCICFVFLFLLL